ncbi:TonB-dependent receptor [Pararhodonellum marinum]|uniref:TonB-dependent receptor n=1 Tax=Pararhodonellum marinum TaxID=2755358 RepID=UPI00188EEA8C|nr:TonB-dependent receptor [Pararhodonellum marinum]
MLKKLLLKYAVPIRSYTFDLMIGFRMHTIMRLGIMTLLALLSAKQLSAQNNPDTLTTRQLEQVTVTAQKQTENLQDVPVSVTSFGAMEIQNLRLWNNEGLSGFAPNLYAAHSGDGRTVMGIRGIATTSYDPAVVTYIDGVLQFGLDTYFNTLLDVERIEVLRGPQGTLYGRNAMGGVINIITQQPTNTTKGFVGVDIGNYGLQRYSAGIKTPLVKDKLFLGVSGLWENHDGFFTNDFDGSKFDRRRALMGNYYLRYLATNRLAFTLNLKHNNNRNFGAFPLAGSIEQALENPFRVNQNAVTRMVDDVFNVSLSAEYTAENYTLTSQTAFQSNYRIYEEPIDGDFSPLDIVSIVNNFGREWNRVKVWTQEIRLASVRKPETKISWHTGVFGFLQDDPVRQGIYFGENADLFGSPFTDFTQITTNVGNNYGMAWFGQGTYHLDPKWDVTFGLRFDYESRELTANQEVIFGSNPPILTQGDTTGKASFNAFSPKVILSRNLAENRLLFLSYSRGFRAGGITQLSSDPGEIPLLGFDPEFSDNFELGFKSDWMDNRLRWNASLFYTLVSDVQVPILILPDAIVVTTNEGSLISKGVESELTGLIGKKTMLSWNVGFTDARFTNLNLGGEGNGEDLSGNRQLFTPDFTSSLIAQYQTDISSEKNLSLIARAEWIWIGNTYYDLANTLKQDPYHLVNSRIALRKDKLELALWARNMLDTKYVNFAYNFGAAHLGNPATFGLSARFDF